MKYRANPVIVDAWKISEVKSSNPDGTRLLYFEDREFYKATLEQMARMIPVAGDYLVVQSDGYAYLNPKDVFERKYSAVN